MPIRGDHIYVILGVSVQDLRILAAIAVFRSETALLRTNLPMAHPG